jgi:hypothetical protein
VRNEVIHRVKMEKNKCILHTIKKNSWIGHILRRKYLLKHVIEGGKGKDRFDRKRERRFK